MYINKLGEKITVCEVVERIKASPHYMERLKKWAKDKHEWDDNVIERDAWYFVSLNDAIIDGGRDAVYEVLVKEPRGNLDSGWHYWDIYFMFVSSEGKAERRKVFIPCLMDTLRGDGYLCWGSGAIGMSRLMDASNPLTYWLAKFTGTEIQLS